jgi:predicted DNA-binding antitoxin AbrB/MazE fold protein
MAIVVEATYENGVLKPAQPLPLAEHEKVQITVDALIDPVRASYGLLKWTGDPETLRRIAEDPEFGVLESP